MYWPRALGCLGLAASLWAPVPAAAAQDERCEALFEQGASALAAEQYAKMLGVANDRMRLCPDPESAFLLGLAQANMVDSLIVTDPAEREQLRLSALRHLRIAAAGGDLKPVLRFTVHDWIVHLQSLGPAEDFASEAGEPELELVPDISVEPLEVPPAPPPQPQPVFPWGPIVTGAVSVAALTTGIVLGISASDARDEARSAANQLREIASELDDEAVSDAVRRTRALNEEANSKAKWSTVLLVGGGVAAVTSIVWYVALPPKGKWRWAATPAGLQTTVRF